MCCEWVEDVNCFATELNMNYDFLARLFLRVPLAVCICVSVYALFPVS